jgi:hypothetical protein
MVNDIVNEINAEIKLFADDTSLYLIVDNPNHTTFLLNQDLHQIQRWSEKFTKTAAEKEKVLGT